MIETFNPFGVALAASRKGGTTQIRALTWREIIARLDGGRPARRAFRAATERGSFAPSAACRIALLGHGADHGNPAVNPAGLGNLKPGDGTGVLVTDLRDTAI